MSKQARQFGVQLDTAFQLEASKVTHGEIKLFEALQAALRSLKGPFHVEEYHGGGHQVRFTGNVSHARLDARCELSDLMIVSYSQKSAQVRMTYLQAKFERDPLAHPCYARLSANLEQWYLLSQRPSVKPATTTFLPPPDILSSALLPSVGSFGFFYYHPKKGIQLFYASAIELHPLASGRYGKLASMRVCHTQTVRGHIECQSACNTADFGSSLFRLDIGTPVHAAARPSASVRSSLASTLRALPQSALAPDILALLGQDIPVAPDARPNGASGFGAKGLILLQGETAN